MAYAIRFSPVFERQLSKIKRKDRKLFQRLRKKIKEIMSSPEHYKPLRRPLNGCRRAHLDPFVIIFSIEGEIVIFLYVKHHDKAYKSK
jgi:YafQ family addiction module toxin component